jgi:hypothetical protein
LNAAKDIPAANHDRNFNAQIHQRFDFPGQVFEHAPVNAVTGISGQDFTT